MSANRAKVSEKVYLELNPKIAATAKYIKVTIVDEYGEEYILENPEKIICPQVSTKVPRGNFEIAYMAEVYNLLEVLGNKKIQVLKYLLKVKDGNNCINSTIAKIAEGAGCDYVTAQRALKIMKEQGALKKDGSVYMLDPGTFCKRSQAREAHLMRKWDLIDAAIIDATNAFGNEGAQSNG